MHNDPPLGVLKFPYKLQHMDTRRAKPLKKHQRTIPKNHSRFLNFGLRIFKIATLNSPAASKSLPRHPLERPLESTDYRIYNAPFPPQNYAFWEPSSSFAGLRDNFSSRRKRPNASFRDLCRP